MCACLNSYHCRPHEMALRFSQYSLLSSVSVPVYWWFPIAPWFPTNCDVLGQAQHGHVKHIELSYAKYEPWDIVKYSHLHHHGMSLSWQNHVYFIVFPRDVAEPTCLPPSHPHYCIYTHVHPILLSVPFSQYPFVIHIIMMVGLYALLLASYT